MHKKMKLHVLFLVTLMMLCFSVESVSAQCDRAFFAARDQYYSGQYESVQNLLIPCTIEILNNRDFYISNNEVLVFKVYKLLITAYYDSDYDYLAEERKQQLIDFFGGVYRPDDVLYRLNTTVF